MNADTEGDYSAIKNNRKYVFSLLTYFGATVYEDVYANNVHEALNKMGMIIDTWSYSLGGTDNPALTITNVRVVNSLKGT